MKVLSQFYDFQRLSLTHMQQIDPLNHHSRVTYLKCRELNWSNLGQSKKGHTNMLNMFKVV